MKKLFKLILILFFAANVLLICNKNQVLANNEVSIIEEKGTCQVVPFLMCKREKTQNFFHLPIDKTYDIW
ncbi:MAG: hypothetical protein IKC35_04930 [Clostridia bacterium]|nr:hypothetical protein [Clostridia bacterium]